MWYSAQKLTNSNEISTKNNSLAGNNYSGENILQNYDNSNVNKEFNKSMEALESGNIKKNRKIWKKFIKFSMLFALFLLIITFTSGQHLLPDRSQIYSKIFDIINVEAF